MSVNPHMIPVAQPSLAAGSPGILARRVDAEQGCSPHLLVLRSRLTAEGGPVLRSGATAEGGQAGKPALRAAFTLIEMLVVIAVIGIVAAISVPALKNFKRVDADAAATRQLADEIANARQRAISQRADVYMVFVPPMLSAADQTDYQARLASLSPQERQAATNLLRLQFTGYNFYSERTVGDQPGMNNPRYLGEWRQLPEGTFIATTKFSVLVNGVGPFYYRAFPFPLATSQLRVLPYIGFDHQGRVFHWDAGGNRLYGPDDVIIPLARGSVSSPSPRVGVPLTASAEEKPPGNSTNAYTHIRVSWLTGRASIERQQVQ